MPTFEIISNKQASFDGMPHHEWLQVQLPTRGTAHSAGYDFYSPRHVDIAPHEIVRIPTGIKARMEEGLVLMLYVRSSIGIKKNLMLANGTGVVDADYYEADNEGHIWAVLVNYGGVTRSIERGERFIQGVFMEYVSCGDKVENLRVGGIGSTSK